MRKRVHREIFFFTCLLLAFFLPVFPRILPSIIVVMIVNWIISGVYLTTIPELFKTKWRFMTLSFASLYLLYVIGMLYSTDYAYGWFDLEVKLSLFIFPLIFASSDRDIFNKTSIRLLFSCFVAGCIAGSILLLGHTWLVHERWGVANAFYYTNLTWYFHSSYLAMYYTFGVAIALYYLADDFLTQPVQKSVIMLLIVLYLEAFIFLLSSKAGLLMLITTEVLFILILFFRKAGLTRIIIVSAIFIMIFLGFSRVFPYAFMRISKADSVISSTSSIQPNSVDGTVARMEIWKVSAGLIKQNFLFGVGTGDVKDVLTESYRQNKLYPILKKNLNAHNQYIQTFIALGLFGFSLLVASLLFPAYRSLRNKDFIYLIFILIFVINILFESMLETQAGVVFYAFFNALLFSKGASLTSISELPG